MGFPNSTCTGENGSQPVSFPSDIFIAGDVELIMGMKTHHHSVLCTSETEVLFLHNEIIEKVLSRRNTQTLTIMRQLVTEKLLRRVNSKNCAQAQLYRALLWKLERMNKTQHEDTTEEVHQTGKQRDLMIARLVKLFMADKMPFIEPRVPDTVYHKIKSLYRERRSPSPSPDPRRPSVTPKPSTSTSAQSRLARAKFPQRKARSRRQLERLQSHQEQKCHLDLSLIKPKSLNEHNSLPGNKVSNARKSKSEAKFIHGRKARPQTAVGLTTPYPNEKDLPEVDETSNGIFKLTESHMYQKNETASQSTDSLCEESPRISGINTSARPKSAPFEVTYNDNSHDTKSDSDEECFDWETSDAALEILEDKIRKFHDRQDTFSRKMMPYRLQEMRRFNIQVSELS